MAKLQKGINDLKTWCLNNGDFGSKLLNEWTGECEDGKHYEIDGVSFGSGKRFKWKCSEGHEWISGINNRTAYKTGCNKCKSILCKENSRKAKLYKGENDLKMWCSNNAEFGRQLLNEWTGECEDGKHYEIDEISFGSKKKFKWKCSNGHEWTVGIVNRTAYKTKCPYCSGNRVSDKNSLKNWCLNNGDFGQRLLQEWTGDCEDDKHYKIDEVSFGSKKKFRWRCKEGHVWLAKVLDRSSQQQGCPYCSGKRVSGKNSLQRWCLSNTEFGQQLIHEWTGQCEDGKHYAITAISFSSAKQFKWKCDKGHEWIVGINSRTAHKTGCPYCSGSRVSNENSLKSWCLDNGDFGQQLMDEWIGECDDGKHYEIDEVSFGSRKKFKWRCKEGHVWFVDINSRTKSRTGCPTCSSNIVGIKISQSLMHAGESDLKTWCLNNGDFGQQLMNEWTGIRDDGRYYKIDEVAKASAKKFKWKCSKGHEWFAAICSRTSRKNCCPYCNHQSTSYPEQFIYWSLKQIYPNTENRCRVLKSPQNPHGIEFDIGIPDIPLCIEYSPTYWHNTREEQDEFKKELCEKANVRLIQIIEDSYDELKHTTSGNYICFKMDYSKQDEMLIHIVDHILKSLGHSISEIDIEIVKKNAWEYSKGKVAYEKSLEFNYPELAKEWHQTINNGLKPADITCGSHREIYWQCKNCSYGSDGEWCVAVWNRVHGKSGCPSCGYNYSDGKTHKLGLAETGINDLQFQHPELAKEWHPTLNKDLKPDKIKCGSGTKIYWQCQKCNYGSIGEWYIATVYRTYRKSGCPRCNHNWYKAQQGLPQKYKGIYSHLNNQDST